MRFTILVFLSLASVSFQASRILVQSQSPVVVCTSGTVGNSTLFQGIEITLFDEIYSSFGLSGGDYEYECADSEDTIFAKLTSDPSTYIAGFGGLKPSLKYQFQGFTYSKSPTFQSGLSILVAQKRDEWLFLRIFSLQTGLTLMISAVFMGVLHYYLERKAFAFERYLWNAFTSIFFVSVINVRGVPARIIQVAFWFIIIILTASYSAALTAIMTSDQTSLEIRNVADLKNTVIKTRQELIPILPFYGIKPLLDERSKITSSNVLGDLEQDSIQGYAIDDPTAQILSRKNCQLSKRVKLFHQYGFYLVFGVGTSDSVVDNVNLALQEALENTSSTQRVENYIENALGLGTRCAGKVPSASDKMKISDLIELIYILGGGLGLGIFFHLLGKTKGYRKMRQTLVQNHIIGAEKDFVDTSKKTGDDLIVENLKEVTKNCVKNLEGTINERLDEMEDRVTKFYETLLNNGNHDLSYSREGFQFDESKFFQEESSFKPSVDRNNFAEQFDDMKDEIPGEDVILQSPTRSLLQRNSSRITSATRRKKSEE